MIQSLGPPLKENTSMTKKGQSFIFILEQSKDSYDYDSRKYLNTYLNRISIEEDDQNEISSIHEFKHASFGLFKSNNRRDENHEIWRVVRYQNMCMIKTF